MTGNQTGIRFCRGNRRAVAARRLAGFYDCAEDDVFLTPTGMAAQFAALQAISVGLEDPEDLWQRLERALEEP